MPEYLAPGVYVEEVPSSVRPIAGVGTSTAGFIGVVAANVSMPVIPGGSNNATYTKAQAGVPVKLTGWEEFKRHFGDIQSGNKMLAHAVYGFFNNGGTVCWVIRVTSLTIETVGDVETDQVADALAEFEAIDEIALVAVPMVSDLDSNDAAASKIRRAAVRELIITHCEKMEDRFAILDAEETVDGNFVPSEIYANPAGDAMGKTTAYGAVYFPWIDVRGTGEYVPPCGHIAGIYARVDSQRGVHKAPANEVIRGALGLKYRLSKAHQTGLNPDGINIIRQFNGNITVWGARTAGGDANTELKYINVRRLLNYIRESIEDGTRWVVFEPNDMSLWQKVRRNVSAFLTNTWRSGALFGETPAQAFYVKCDAETNPPEVRELGQVITEIGVAIVKPAEFVIFRISQWAGPEG